MHQFLKFILFRNIILHVSDSLSVHHQEFKTVHTATRTCHWYCYLLASKQVAVPIWHKPVAMCTILNSWWWTERPSETCRVILNWINQQDAATLQVYYLSFRYSSTCFGHPHAHHRELQQLQPLVYLRSLEMAVLLVVVGPVVSQPAWPRPTALLSPSSDGKPEAATAVVAPDDRHGDARNMLSCI